jgi:hypothetical protein
MVVGYGYPLVSPCDLTILESVGWELFFLLATKDKKNGSFHADYGTRFELLLFRGQKKSPGCSSIRMDGGSFKPCENASHCGCPVLH